MPSVEIEYSVPHGYRRRAEDIRDQIQEELGETVDEVVLTEGDKMDFLVRVDGDLVFDKKKQGYNPKKIMARLKQRIPQPEPDEEGEQAEAAA